PEDVVACAHAPEIGDFLESTVSSALPLPVPTGADLTPQTPTPSEKEHSALNFSGVVSSVFAQGVALETPPLSKAGHNLRLPSFDLLGIGAPHPDRKVLTPNQLFSGLGAGPLSKPDDPLHSLSPSLARAQPDFSFGGLGEGHSQSQGQNKRAQNSLSHLVPTFTPPEDNNITTWSAFAKVTTAAMDSPARSDPSNPPTSPDDTTVNPTTTTTTTTTMTTTTRYLTHRDSQVKMKVEPVPAWLQAATATFGKTSVRVLSHALPCPSPDGHVFPVVISLIHDKIPPRSTTWINVFHAVPGKFNLSDLPTSPPSTPGPAVGGDSYFATKVFDSAVPVSDYQSDSTAEKQGAKPVVPPSSVDVSVVERYIPPTNRHEFSELFNPNGPSLLIDRLVELSPSKGHLLFIYITRAGGNTFLKEYIGPVLDPILRTMVVVSGFSSELSSSLGKMTSVEHLMEFDVLETRISDFCKMLSTTSNSLERFEKKKATFQLVHSAKEYVRPKREVWARDWWRKQEKPRIRKAVETYFKSNPLMATEIPTAYLIQEILQGVETKLCPDPENGIEVGVFVIRK
ncbi:hypothetical protein M501DRAFT_904465, partial [Patellaria atrata CBS 101060]